MMCEEDRASRFAVLVAGLLLANCRKSADARNQNVRRAVQEPANTFYCTVVLLYVGARA
jgi:nitrous oxide reductase accessory protein NosL